MQKSKENSEDRQSQKIILNVVTGGSKDRERWRFHGKPKKGEATLKKTGKIEIDRQIR